ncbi:MULTISPECIES: hypothetical protein [Pseudoalteromonas]|uniref:Uncharacterized protein n=1 Tax=Pseudoalteromonas amylolytica TaxID=1859457 RepID=A0A1S1MR53_9GAMM|nr:MULTISPECIES: hypothetical protein [Pseudoalteromonas]MCF6435848.1 hypothetical protein [Pseudoalteromonas sp. MMG022]OHU86667.1 hypothetical protein BFC16_14270 [Pseudoalteromonas sp. JW3]OHU88809.1 hypothetical protein BET10_18485 [Pseudoalteromonas amylolytica]
MEEVTEGLFRGIARFIKWLFIDMLIQSIFYGCGYATLKVVTLGTYPKPNRIHEGLCIAVGVVLWFVLIGVFAYLG